MHMAHCIKLDVGPTYNYMRVLEYTPIYIAVVSMRIFSLQLGKKNYQEARNIDVIFSTKQAKEKELEELKAELAYKKRAVEDVVDGMEGGQLEHYQTLTAENDKIKKVNKHKAIQFLEIR